MPDAMELLARSLRAGHALPAAIELVGEEMPEPMGTEMMIVYEEQQFGISTSEALLHLLERVESMDLRYFVAAVIIQTGDRGQPGRTDGKHRRGDSGVAELQIKSQGPHRHGTHLH